MGEQAATVWVADELRFLLSVRHRRGPITVPLDGTSSVGHLVESLGVPRTEIGPLRVAGLPANLRTRPRPGDRIEVFPVPRPQPVPEHGFVLDVHLGALARRMRLLGLDTAYRNDAADPELVAQAATERRAVLTQDRGLLRRRALTAGAYVRGGTVDEQLTDVLDRFDPPLAPWTRCLACNGVLQPVDKPAVRHLLKPGTLRTYTEFSRCPECRRVYWRGAHARRLHALVAQAAKHPEPDVGAGVPESRDEPDDVFGWKGKFTA